ncbi:unnamed protein product [Discula destructiva]
MTLTFLHLASTTILTQVLARTSPHLTRPSNPITGRLYLRAILPIGLLYTLSLICANMSYNALPLPIIQIAKALAPLTTLVMSWAASLTNPKVITLFTMGWIAAGVLIAGLGGDPIFMERGLWFCLGATAAECARLLIVERLLKEPRRGRFPGAGSPVYLDEDVKRGPTVTVGETAMSPLAALCYFAPVCASLSGSMALAFEMKTFRVEDVQRVGGLTLALSCFLACLLNVAGVLLISKSSALTVSLLGVLKSPIPILASLLIWKTSVSYIQMIGYGVSLCGMFNHGFISEPLGPLVIAWAEGLVSSASRSALRESMEPLLAKATSYSRTIITIVAINNDEEMQRGRTARREGTRHPSPEKTRLSPDSSSKGGEPPTSGDFGRLPGEQALAVWTST